MNHVGLCTRRSKNNVATSCSNQAQISPINYIEIKEEKIEESAITFNPMQIVKSHDHCDNENFFECWEATFEERQEIMSSMSTVEYIASFPYTLKSDVGYEIVSSKSA